MAFYYINSTKEVYKENDEISFFEETVDYENEKIDNEDTIIVHIAGAVKNNGIVKVKENARLNDVIEAAGGMNEDADLEKINLAYIVEDGQKIYIPSIKERETEENEIVKTKEDSIIQKGGGDIVVDTLSKSNSNGKININQANIEELKTLPGIRRCNCFKNNFL